MSNSHTIRNLTTLVGLRSTEVERLQTEMAAQTAVRDRYQKNLERLTSLYTDSGPSGALHLALSVNCGNFKQSVMEWRSSTVPTCICMRPTWRFRSARSMRPGPSAKCWTRC